MHELMDRLEVIERKDKVFGIISASSIGIVLFLALLWWISRAGLVMGIEEPEWKTIGLIGPGGMDYGTDDLGSGEVNNFFAPSANPADRPPTPNSSNSNESSAAATNAAASTPATNGVITGNEETGVNANSGQKENPTPTKPDPKATGTGNGTNSNGTNNNAGGSNDGNTNTVGNHGDPRSTVLNPDGKFAWGTGIGGAGGRMPIKTELTGYNVQLEEKIRFEITIDPSGDVIFVRAPFAINQELVAIGKENIKKWKFSETDPSAGNLKTTVTISFRLK
jgi:hypothetical protein